MSDVRGNFSVQFTDPALYATMRETLAHRTASVGWPTSAAIIKGRQLGLHRTHLAWLAAMYAGLPDAPRPNLTTRAVRFALEHWHANA